jgi:metallo-beta-lactamase family protein
MKPKTQFWLCKKRYGYKISEGKIMKIKFLGAAGTVTGSKYLLTIGEKKYLVDCGLFQGHKELRERNWRDFDVSPREIEAVFLTHAHIDHSGSIPRLIKSGFRGPIYCSAGTNELVKIMLPDSGHLQEEEARFANKKAYTKHKPALPLYTRADAEQSLSYFHPVEFHKTFKVNDVAITFNRVGHILGASCILLEADGRKIAFSGDVGRPHDLIMKAPEPMPNADYMVLESTYGDRLHVDEDIWKRLEDIINEAVKLGSVVVIPAFAIGRAQNILYFLHELTSAGRIPKIDTYLDSPMAIDATDIYCRFSDEHKLKDRVCSAMFKSVKITRTPEESKAINRTLGPKVIISASGMASGGRVLHHLSHYLPDKKNIVIIVGFQAMGTRGRALLDGAPQVKIFGQYVDVNARIEYISGLSAHADYDELIVWLKNSPIKHPRVFLTHGEQKSAETFADELRKVFQWQVEVPKDGDEFSL